MKRRENLFDPKILRQHVLDMAFKGQTVHIPCAFSIIEILSTLYSTHLKYNPRDMHDKNQNYFILSKDHNIITLYACMRQLDWLEQKNLDQYFKDGSLLHGLAEARVPGLEVTSGSLGHGLPIATGIAYGLKRRKSHRKVYCLVGDGELNEGSMWEAIQFADHHELDNLIIIVDANGFQAMGETKLIMDMEPMVDKFVSFGFDAVECDGHDAAALSRCFDRLGSQNGKPKALVARTIKGKGISFMENDNRWHYSRLTEELYQKASSELFPNGVRK
jgi:transketolase